MQVISISSLKGGVGKTSITLGLASAAWAAGVSTLVIDLDPHADTTTGLGIKHDDMSTEIGTMLRKPKQFRLHARRCVRWIRTTVMVLNRAPDVIRGWPKRLY